VVTLVVPERDDLLVPPAHVWRPPRQRSMAPQLAQLAEALERPLDPEQVFAADVLTGTRADGRAASLGAAIIAPRQNVKSWLFELIALGRLLAPGGDRLVVWSAHEVKTAQESFTDLQLLIDSHRWLRRRVTKIVRANGKEGIEFVGGRRLAIRARIKTGGRGLSGDCVFLDEAFALTPAHMGSLLPILSTRRRAAVFYGSSAGLVTSEVLRGVRDRGRKGGRGAPAYVEWCVPGSLLSPGCAQPKCLHAPGTPGCTLDREELWIACNLAAYPGRRISIEYLREERAELPPAEFARERLGWWDEDGGSLVTIPVDAWDARADTGSRIAGRRALAFDITPDRKVAAIGGAGWRSDDAKHLALIEHRAGTSWLVPRLLELVERHDPAAVVVDGASPAATEIEALKQAGLRLRTADNPNGVLVVLGASDMARACGAMYDAVAGDEPDAYHRGDPVLQQALKGAARRPMGDGGWAFGRRTSAADISPIVAVTEAHYGLTTTRPDRGPMVAWR
jgi:hypothetical protein